MYLWSANVFKQGSQEDRYILNSNRYWRHTLYCAFEQLIAYETPWTRIVKVEG